MNQSRRQENINLEKEITYCLLQKTNKYVGEKRLVSQFSTKMIAVMPGNGMNDEVLPMLGLIAANHPFTNHMIFFYMVTLMVSCI